MNKKPFFRWWFLILISAVLSLACNLTADSETPPAVDVSTVEVSPPTAENQPPTEALPTESEPPATALPPAPTATLPSESEPEPEQPTPTSETAVPDPTATTPATAEPDIPAPGTIAPGLKITGTLESGGVQFYTFEATKFEPVLAFAEADQELDLALSAYLGTVTPGTDLEQLQPISQGDFSEAGGPEILVISPDVAGPITIAVQGKETVGNFTLYLYNGRTPADNTQLINDSLAPGQTNNYKAISNGGRPVIIFVDPTDQSDVVLQVQYESGALITVANFGGDGSAETAYVLPRTETAYTILVSEVDGQTSTYTLVIVTLD